MGGARGEEGTLGLLCVGMVNFPLFFWTIIFWPFFSRHQSEASRSTHAKGGMRGRQGHPTVVSRPGAQHGIKEGSRRWNKVGLWTEGRVRDVFRLPAAGPFREAREESSNNHIRWLLFFLVGFASKKLSTELGGNRRREDFLKDPSSPLRPSRLPVRRQSACPPAPASSSPTCAPAPWSRAAWA